MTVLTTRFSASKPPSYAVGRHGELIVVQGNGVRPLRWLGAGTASDAGMDAPALAPTVAVSSTVKYYVARVDVYKGGDVYYSPPAVSFSAGSTPPTRPAVASAYLNSASVREVRLTDGGKGYTSPPNVTLSNTFGTGATIEAQLDAPDMGPDTPTNSRLTGLTGWEIVQGPPYADETELGVVFKTKWRAYGSVIIPIANGSGIIQTTLPIVAGGSCFGVPATYPVGVNIPYTVSGVTSGSGATVSIGFSGHLVTSAGTCSETSGGGFNNCTCVGFEFMYSSGVSGVSAINYGAGYSSTDSVTLTLPAYASWNQTTRSYVTAPSSKALILRGYSGSNPNNPTGGRYSVRSLTLKTGGSGYTITPNIKISSESGFGAYATCKVTNGAVTSVALENSGGGYKTPPTVQVVSGGAEAFAVVRPHLRGLYQCYYRYVDATPEGRGGPIASNLSPLKEVDCGEGSSQITWQFTAPTGRQSKVELWRSASNEATTLYRVTGNATASFVDDLTDEELRDADRAGYAAMPIVLPNGELNANRFGIPPSDKSAVVMFQDRMWYGVDTSGSEPNVIYFSEVDEPESVPDVNQLVLQQNVQSTDSVKALIPFGSTLMAMQSRHAYAITYVRKPLVDAQISLVGYRGCLNQRCWDLHDGVAYVMDQYGVYSITNAGEIKPLSDVIKDYFLKKIDFANTTWFMVRFDPALSVLRCFVACKEDNSSGYPTRCLAFSPLTESWWEERYPQKLTGATTIALSNGDFRNIYGGDGGVYVLGEGATDAARGTILSVKVTNPGAGYRTPPFVTVPGGSGALLEPAVNGETGVGSIWIKSGGYGYVSGNVTIGPPDDPDHPAPVQATAVFTASPLTADLSVATGYCFRSGNVEYDTDTTKKDGASQQSRDISLLYAPQQKACTVSVRCYYNNSKEPRRNAAMRDRGTGFVNSDVEPAARLDMSEFVRKYGSSSGMAKALFAGRTMEDIQAADRHVSVELDGVRRHDEPVIFYGVDVGGNEGK
jgi:hypothetical protein